MLYAEKTQVKMLLIYYITETMSISTSMMTFVVTKSSFTISMLLMDESGYEFVTVMCLFVLRKV